MKYTAKCFECKNHCIVETNEYVPLFNETKKRNWLSFVCEKCQTENKGARMVVDSNQLLAITA